MYLDLLKAGTSFVIGSGVGTIIGHAVRATTPEVITKFQKFSITVGTMAISAYAANGTANYTNEVIDEIAEAVKSANEARKEKKSLKKEAKAKKA